jgi:hypothetical protein
MLLRAILLAMFSLAAGCGGDTSDGDGDSDADVDSDSDSDSDTHSAGGDCTTNCQAEDDRCGSGMDECISECEAAGAVDFAAWTSCLNDLSPPCGDLDQTCCMAALSCRPF